ncbi:MAG: hypothetical protein SGPRY_001129 [Prymnesium sp.]
MRLLTLFKDRHKGLHVLAAPEKRGRSKPSAPPEKTIGRPPMHKKMVIKHDGGIPALSAYSDNSASEPEYFVDRIMDAYIGEGGKWKYLVRWQGYGEDFDSWEPEENLSALKKELKEAREYVRQASGLSPEAKSASSPSPLNSAHNLISGRRSSTETAYSPVDGKRRLQVVEERGAGIESAERCDEKDESSISEEGSEEDETSSVVRPTRLERNAAKPERKARAPSPSSGEDSGKEEDGSLASEESEEDDRNLSLRFKRREPSAGMAEARMAGAVGKAAPSSTNARASSGAPKHVSKGPPARSGAKRRRQESASKSSDSPCPAAQESRAKRIGLAHSEHTPPLISAPQPIGLQPLGKAHRRPVGMLNNVLAGRSCGDAGVRSKLPAETAPSRHAQESAHPPSPPICKPVNLIAGLDLIERIDAVRKLYLRRSRMESDMHFITQPAYLIWLTNFLCAGCSRTSPSLVQTGSLLRISKDDALTLVGKLKMLEDSKEMKDFDAREGGHATASSAPAKLLPSNREAQLRQQLARQASVAAKDSFPGSGPCRWNGKGMDSLVASISEAD